jgi:hypothetical protein
MKENPSTIIASEAKQSIGQHAALWIASSLTLPCANASRLSQAMTKLQIRNSQEDRS